MKDECAAEYVGLRPKMYSLKKSDNGEIRKAKSVKKYLVKKHIKHEQYIEALFNGRTFKHEMNTLRSVNYRIYWIKNEQDIIIPLRY